MLLNGMIGIILIFLRVVHLIKGDNFPSLITTNATLAVIIDREFIGEEYDNIKIAIEQYIIYAKREILKHGGVNVQFYSWTSINVKRDITAILSIASCSDTWRLFQAAEDEDLLLMAISESDCPRLPLDQAITVPLLTRGEEMPQLLLDLRMEKSYSWKSAVILYDDSLSRDMITRVITSITKESAYLLVKAASVSLMKLETNTTTTKFRKSLEETLSTVSTKRVGGNFLVVVSYDIVEIIMECAKSLKLVNTKNQWLYVVSDTSSGKKNFDRFRPLLREGDNVAFLFNNTMINNTCTSGLKCHSEEILSSFTKALDDAVQDEYEIAGQVSDEEWEAIRPSKMERRNFLLGNIKRYLSLHGICDNCTSWRIKTSETWGREFQQNLSQDSVAQLLTVGSWRPSDGPAMSDELFPHIAHGFRGRILPLISFHNPPWQVLRTNDSGDVIEYKGLVFDIINELANILNFTFTVHIIKPKDKTDLATTTTNSTGALMQIAEILTNTIPDIFIEMIQNKTIAIGAGAFTITEQNKYHVNFTIPIATQTYTFLVSRPRELSRALLFMSPFTGDTWLCLSAAIIAMGPILYYIHKFSPVYKYKGISMKGGLSSVENCIWYMYGALLQQGGMHLPYADSARIIVGAWWLVVLVVATTYCGNLVAFLTFPKIDIPITTINELLAHRETVTWSIPKDSFLEKQLKHTLEPKFKHLYDGKADIEKSLTMIKGIEDGKHVFFDWKIRLQHIMKQRFMETDRCNLALGQEEFFDEQLAMIVSQDTPYLEIINDEIKKLHQVGLIQKWLQNYLPRKDRCWKNRHIVEVNNHTVNMDDMQGSFFVLCLGFSLALLLIIIEKLWFKHVTKKKEKIIQPFAK